MVRVWALTIFSCVRLFFSDRFFVVGPQTKFVFLHVALTSDIVYENRATLTPSFLHSARLSFKESIYIHFGTIRREIFHILADIGTRVTEIAITRC